MSMGKRLRQAAQSNAGGVCESRRRTWDPDLPGAARLILSGQANASAHFPASARSAFRASTDTVRSEDDWSSAQSVFAIRGTREALSAARSDRSRAFGEGGAAVEPPSGPRLVPTPSMQASSRGRCSNCTGRGEQHAERGSGHRCALDPTPAPHTSRGSKLPGHCSFESLWDVLPHCLDRRAVTPSLLYVDIVA